MNLNKFCYNFFSDDLRFPLVYGEGKRSRLLATIGVTRGFGDHDLKAQSNSGNHVYIKPFLTPQPEVRVLDIENEDVTESDVLIMATGTKYVPNFCRNDESSWLFTNRLRAIYLICRK